jgi:DNA modification methylase
LHLGGCLEVMRGLADNSVDACVTDPPYGYAFMGKSWDYDVPSVEIWKEVFRVLKPGAHLLAFGGTRTYHRLVVNIEDAGFEIRDQIQWLYGQGFPKSLDISKAIDKAAGAEREIIGVKPRPDGNERNYDQWTQREETAKNCYGKESRPETEIRKLTAPATDAAKEWEGWGTALKPANEPIVLARKPCSERTVAANVQKWRTGGLNIDECRVGYASEADRKHNTESLSRFSSTSGKSGSFMASKEIKPNTDRTALGRFPANLILDEVAAGLLDEQSGVLKSGNLNAGHKRGSGVTSYDGGGGIIQRDYGGDKGGASRFFYVAKPSRRERNQGLESFPLGKVPSKLVRCNGSGETRLDGKPASQQQNIHPTVKPIKLMEYLCRLVTPSQGVVLDPFMGSGTTGIACKTQGFGFCGIELNSDYFNIAQKRIHEGVGG